MIYFLVALGSVAVGAAVSSLWWHSQQATLRNRLADSAQRQQAQAIELIDLRDGRSTLMGEVAKAQAEVEAERRVFDQAREQMADQFGALSARALEQNNRQFMDLAKSSFDKVQSEAQSDYDTRAKSIEQLVDPLKESLARVDQKMQQLEVARTDAYSSLVEQVKSVGLTQDKLRSETASLVTALRAPQVRGRWGEMQLRRVVEVAGMLEHCDFNEQVTVVGEFSRLRPDVVVQLAGRKQVVIDAKVPFLAYIEAVETQDPEERSDRLKIHARHLRNHIDQLSGKEYWSQFENSPDFVVLFIPGEPFMSAALDVEPGLLEYAMAKNIVLATPTTLITLLRSVAYGWNQDALATNAREICEVGRELYKRICTMGVHMTKVGSSLDKAVDAYNKQVGSLERSVVPKARKLASLEGITDEFESPTPIERQSRPLQAAELLQLASCDDDENDQIAN